MNLIGLRKGAADKSYGCVRWCKTNLFGSCQEASLSARLSALKCKERGKGGRNEHTSYNQYKLYIAIFLMCTTYVACRLTSNLPGLSHHGCYASISFLCVRMCMYVCAKGQSRRSVHFSAHFQFGSSIIYEAKSETLHQSLCVSRLANKARLRDSA